MVGESRDASSKHSGFPQFSESGLVRFPLTFCYILPGRPPPLGGDLTGIVCTLVGSGTGAVTRK